MSRIGDFFDEIEELLEREYMPLKSHPVYHYTTGTALKNILTNQELWLSERGCMNDVVDRSFVDSLIAEGIRKWREDEQYSILDGGVAIARKQYVFSTSLERDLIHQWAYYGDDDGYCLEFDRDELASAIQYRGATNAHLFHGPVIYDEMVASRVIDFVIAHVNAVREETILEDCHDEVYELLEHTEEALSILHSTIKQHGHYCEKEYRYTIHTPECPKLKENGTEYLPVRPIKKLPVRGIMIGPFCDYGQAVNEVQRWLETAGYGHGEVPVVRSDLMVRRRQRG